MGLEIEYTGDDGRKYDSLAGMVGAEGNRLINEMVLDVKRAVEAERCHVHGKKATVSVTRGGDQVSYTIDGCCDELVERAQQAAEAAVQ